jgi:quinoprotein glucose dehydrogenase
LIDANIDGKPRKLVSVPTKQGWLYTFDRITGQPIWPMPETPVPQSDIPFEKTSPTQPIPSKPPAYSRTFVSVDDLIDFTPELRARALENLKQYRWEPSPFVPPVAPGSKYLGSINIANTSGGINWPGASFDPETAIFYGQAGNSAVTAASFSQEEFEQIRVENQKKRLPRWEAEPNYGLGRGRGGEGGGRGAAPQGRGAPPPGAPGGGGGGRGALTAGLEGLPLVKPPYGVLSAIDLNNGTLKFQVPHGDTPDAVRNHPLLKGMNIPKTGQGGSVGLMVTKTLVVVGDPQVTSPPGRARGAMLRAYDKQTGQQVGEVLMPAQQSGSPMTYMVDGRQYIIVAVSGGNYTGEYIAYALPQSEVRPTQQ